jgi:hypothetical protein
MKWAKVDVLTEGKVPGTCRCLPIPSSRDVKNIWGFASTPRISLLGVVLKGKGKNVKSLCF